MTIEDWIILHEKNKQTGDNTYIAPNKDFGTYHKGELMQVRHIEQGCLFVFRPAENKIVEIKDVENFKDPVIRRS